MFLRIVLILLVVTIVFGSPGRYRDDEEQEGHEEDMGRGSGARRRGGPELIPRCDKTPPPQKGKERPRGSYSLSNGCSVHECKCPLRGPQKDAKPDCNVINLNDMQCEVFGIQYPALSPEDVKEFKEISIRKCCRYE